MTFGWRVFLISILVACTEPNPRSCKDGLCTDQRYPFCDVDGAVAGEPETCITVTCTPDEFAMCRGDLALRCNATGNDFDLVQCQRGCDPATSRCRDCSDSSQCANPAPICDQGESVCRGCTSDPECPSGICADGGGACIPEAMVVYAAATGVTTGPCTLAEPCSLDRAVLAATTAAITPTLRLLPGTYAGRLEILAETSSPLVIVGTGATLGTTSGLRVSNGASVEIRGLTIASNMQQGGEYVSCGNPVAGPISSLSLRDAHLEVFSASTMLVAGRCAVRIEQTEIECVTGGTAIQLNAEGTLVMDRVHGRARDGAQVNIVVGGASTRATVTNSVFENLDVVFACASVTPACQLFMAFNTLVYRSSTFDRLYCPETNQSANVQLENNIIVSTTANDAIFRATCTLVNNVIHPQVTARPNNINADPLLVDVAGGDFHLQATSPAVNAAIPSAGLDPPHDFEGTARPQGGTKDIGAFERVP